MSSRSRGPALLLLGSAALLLLLASPAAADAADGAAGRDPGRLALSGSAEGSLRRTWSWTLDASAADGRLVTADRSGTFDLRVVPDHGPARIDDVRLTGTLTVEDATGTGLDGLVLSATTDTGIECPLADGPNAGIPAGGRLVRRFTCDAAPDVKQVTVRAAWAAAEGMDAGSVSRDLAVDWNVTRVDACASITDPLDGSFTRRACVGDEDPAFRDRLEVTGEPGTCTRQERTLTLTTEDRGATAAATVPLVLCRGADPALELTAEAGFKRTWTWDLAAASDDRRLAAPAGTTPSVHREVTVDAEAHDSAWTVTGEIAVTDRNDWQDLVVDVDVTLPGAACAVEDGGGLRVPAGERATRAYRCTADARIPDGAIVATATVARGTTRHPAVAAEAPVAMGAPTERVDACAEVRDAAGAAEAAWTICVADGLPATRAWDADLAGTPGTCSRVDTRATLTTGDRGRNAAAAGRVTICLGVAPTVAVAAEPGYRRTWHWRIDGPEGGRVEILDGTETVVPVRVTADATPEDGGWAVRGMVRVANPNDWQDLVVDVDAALPEAACRVTEGSARTVAAGGVLALDLTCRAERRPADGELTATVKVRDGVAPAGQAASAVPVAFGAPTEQVDACAEITGTGDATGGRTACAADGLPVEAAWDQALTGTPGTCVAIPRSVTVTGRDSGETTAARTAVDVCTLAAPAVDATARAGFTRTHAWSLTTTAEQRVIRARGGTVTLRYVATARQTGFVDAGWNVSGVVTITNPNDWTDLQVDIADPTGGDRTCTVTDGVGVAVARGDAVRRSYRCLFPAAPDRAKGTVAVAVTPAGPSGVPVTVTARYAFGRPTEVIAGTITVIDVLEGSPRFLLGTPAAHDTRPLRVAVDRYSRVVGAPRTGCRTHTSTTTIRETGATSSVTVRVCAARRAQGGAASPRRAP